MWTWIILYTRFSLSALKGKGGLEDYENISAALPVQTPNPVYDDMAETSGDEMELFYARVHFTAKPGCQRAFITCNEEETQYSEVQFWWTWNRIVALLCIFFIKMYEQIIN